MRSWRSESEEMTLEIGARLANELAPDGILLLFGDLGTGKTVLTQGVAQELGFERQRIQSPTYTLMHEYQHGDVRFLHADLYRLESEQVGALGLEEALAGPGVKVVEWADRLPFAPPAAIRLELRYCGQGVRMIEELDT